MRTIFTLLLLFVSLWTTSSTQEDVLNHLLRTNTMLPYNNNVSSPKRDQFIEPYKRLSFPYEVWDSALNVSMWKDFNMTQPLNNSHPECAIYRTFAPKGNYYVGILYVTGLGADDAKKVMVTINPTTGELIDQLEVGYFFGYVEGIPDYHAFSKEFSVISDNSHLIVCISQMKLVQNQEVPIILAPSVQAYLIKKRYRINNTTGKFELIDETTYLPQAYALPVFSGNSRAFGTYGEVVSRNESQRNEQERFILTAKLVKPSGKMDNKAYFELELKNNTNDSLFIINNSRWDGSHMSFPQLDSYMVVEIMKKDGTLYKHTTTYFNPDAARVVYLYPKQSIIEKKTACGEFYPNAGHYNPIIATNPEKISKVRFKLVKVSYSRFTMKIANLASWKGAEFVSDWIVL